MLATLPRHDVLGGTQMEYTAPSNPKLVKDLTGQTFGRLSVVKLLGKRVNHKNRVMFWFCQCQCGNKVEVAGSDLRRGNTQSCGCYQREHSRETNTFHGLARSKEYGIWRGMKKRCRSPNDKDFVSYGARGITVCSRWTTSFGNFYADMGPRPSPQHSLDRIDNSKGYEPGNVRWVTINEQANNKRTNVYVEYGGETMTLAQLARLKRLDYQSLKQHYRRRGLPLIEALAKAMKRSSV